MTFRRRLHELALENLRASFPEKPETELEDIAERSAKHRQDHALDQKLRDYSPSTGAQGPANSHLALATSGARKRQVSYVRTSDQQHQADRSKKHQQDGPRVCDYKFLQRHQGHFALSITLRMSLAHPAENDACFLLRLLQRDAGLQSSDDLVEGV